MYTEFDPAWQLLHIRFYGVTIVFRSDVCDSDVPWSQKLSCCLSEVHLAQKRFNFRLNKIVLSLYKRIYASISHLLCIASKEEYI